MSRAFWLSLAALAGIAGLTLTHKTDSVVPLPKKLPANPSNSNPRRQAIIAALRPLVGLSPHDAAYGKAVYPFDDPAHVLAMSNAQSGCGLTAEVGWREIGVNWPTLYVPYATRTAKGSVYYAVAAEYACALKTGSWVSPSPTMPLPLPADCMIMGCKGCPGVWEIDTISDQHEFTLVSIGAETVQGWPIESIDGGQPGVLVRNRWLVKVAGGKEWWIADISAGQGKRPIKGRRLYGYVNVDHLPLKLAA